MRLKKECPISDNVLGMACLSVVVMTLKYRDKEWLQEQYIEKGKTGDEISVICDVTANTVRKWLHKHDIPVRDKGSRKGKSQKRYPELNNESWLREKYIEQEMSQEQIAKELGCVKQSVKFALDRNDIDTRSQEEAQRKMVGHARKDKRLLDEDWLRQQYQDNTIPEIADMLDVTYPAVRYRLNEYGIDTGDNDHHMTNADRQFQKDPKWDERRQVAIDRDNNQCQDCGVSGEEFERSLDVHHLTKKEEYVNDGEVNWEKANAPDNLVTLCRSCHLERHANGEL